MQPKTEMSWRLADSTTIFSKMVGRSQGTGVGLGQPSLELVEARAYWRGTPMTPPLHTPTQRPVTRRTGAQIAGRVRTAV